MLRVGLTGGIASGKSTVSARLAALGAVVVDADRVAREVVAPGSDGLAEVVRRFGDGVLLPDGSLDRPALGAVVFADEAARRDLEAITHPRIAELSARAIAAAPPDAVVVHDLPLLVEMRRSADYALVVVVEVDEAERVRRMVELRGMTVQQARARVAAQASDAQRRRAADVLVDNSGGLAELDSAVDALWAGRLVPFEQALRAGAGAGWRGGRSASGPGGPGGTGGPGVSGVPGAPGVQERTLARLEAALGPALVSADVGRGEVLLRGVAAVHSHETRVRLRDRGFHVIPERVETTATGVGTTLVRPDPGMPLVLEVREC